MNTRLMMGIALLVAGLLVLLIDDFLRIIVGLTFVIGGLWIALQNAQGGVGGGGNI